MPLKIIIKNILPFMTPNGPWRQLMACIALTAAIATHAYPQADPTTQPTDTAVDPPRDQVDVLPHVAIDRQNSHVDVDATVVLRQGGWLELLACTPQTRTHESILVVHAKPSHIHLALQLVGLKPGAPMRWQKIGDQYQAHPAHGPKVTVHVVVDRGDRSVEVPANQWIVNKQTGQTLPDPIWIFTGSAFDRSQTPPTYRADVEGSVLSLVNFGDEVLTRPGDQTNHNDQGMLQPHTQLIPELGTKVKVRIRPAEVEGP